MSNLLFTVFTPTYNRAHTLGRVYRSLLNQTFESFEWLIVDDGSNDGTKEKVDEFIREKRISIRYFYQPNGGKHTAFNRGVKEARGELFLPFDSDDSCIPTALERFRAHWLQMTESQRQGFSGVTCLCVNEKGQIVGGILPAPILEGCPYEVTSKYRLNGEKWGFHRTEILRAYPFPEIEGERFVPESLVWNRIGRVYKIRFVNEALRCYFSSQDGLSTSMVDVRRKSPKGTLVYYLEVVDLPVRLRDRMRASVNIWRFVFHGRVFREVLRFRKYIPLLAIAFPFGFSCFVFDVIKRRNKN